MIMKYSRFKGKDIVFITMVVGCAFVVVVVDWLVYVLPYTF